MVGYDLDTVVDTSKMVAQQSGVTWLHNLYRTNL